MEAMLAVAGPQSRGWALSDGGVELEIGGFSFPGYPLLLI